VSIKKLWEINPLNISHRALAAALLSVSLLKAYGQLYAFLQELLFEFIVIIKNTKTFNLIPAISFVR